MKNVEKMRGELLYRRKWGVFMHFLSEFYPPQPMTPSAWNAVVDRFDVAALARQLHQVGAGYLMFAAGQNSGFFCAPNPVYDAIVGHVEPHTSKRDLIADLAGELGRYDIALFAYVPSNPPFKDLRAVDAFDFCDVAQCAGRQAEFQRRWESVLRCWAERWGRGLAGWWVDGCYLAGNRKLYAHADEPNFASFARALRAGNPEALVAWNPGVADPELLTVSPEEDYTAGECQFPETVRILGRFEEQAQSHVLSYIGKWWGWREPRYDRTTLIAASRHITDAGGAITWDVPFEPDGRIAPEFLDLLAALGDAYRNAPVIPPRPECDEARLMDNPLIASPMTSGPDAGEVTVTLRLRNTRQRPVANRLELSGAGLTASPTALDYALAPMAEKTIPVRCLLNHPGNPGILRIRNGDWLRRIEICERRQCDLRLGRLEREFTGGVGWLRLYAEGTRLRFEVEARDSIRRRGEPVYSGSCIEFFGAGDETPDDIRQLFASPFENGHLIRVENYRSRRIETSELNGELTANGFRLTGSFPAAMLGWRDSGLFECALHVGRGDEYVYTPLFGSAYAAGSSRSYAALRLPGTK